MGLVEATQTGDSDDTARISFSYLYFCILCFICWLRSDVLLAEFPLAIFPNYDPNSIMPDLIVQITIPVLTKLVCFIILVALPPLHQPLLMSAASRRPNLLIWCGKSKINSCLLVEVIDHGIYSYTICCLSHWSWAKEVSSSSILCHIQGQSWNWSEWEKAREIPRPRSLYRVYLSYKISFYPLFKF